MPGQRRRPIQQIQINDQAIPKFDGQAYKWKSFWRTFKEQSIGVPDVIKMNILKQKCCGEAKKILDAYFTTASNYRVAVEHLQHLFEDPEKIYNSVVDALKDLDCAPFETEAMQKMVNELRALLSHITDMRTSVDSDMFRDIVIDKFQPDITYNLHLKWNRMGGRPFKITDILRDLQTEIDVLKTKEIAKQAEIEERIRAYEERSVTTECLFCGEVGHRPVNCSNRIATNRYHLVVEKRTHCMICYEPGHLSPNCKEDRCSECNGPHHQELCLLYHPRDNQSRLLTRFGEIPRIPMAYHEVFREVFTCGVFSSDEKIGPTAGWGMWWGDRHAHNSYGPVWGEASENRAGLIAVLKALEIGRERSLRRIHVKTNIEWVANVLNDKILKWKRRGWKGWNGEKKKDHDILEHILRTINYTMAVKYEYVVPSAENQGYEMAQQLAQKGLKEY